MVRVLFVEDSDEDVFIATHRLEKSGMDVDVRTVCRSDEFKGALSSWQPDIILSDVSVPGFDGFAALDIARVAAPQIPFLFFSGGGDKRMIDAVERGAYAVVNKDYADQLATLVNQALRR